MQPELQVNLATLIAAVTAIGALGAAAFALVDATKAFGGGISIVGLADIQDAARRFAAALDVALEPGAWREVVRDHWINGRPRGEQKAIVKALVRLGLNPDTAPQIAAAAHVNPDALRAVATKLQIGAALDDADVQVLGRLDVSVDAYLDAAFDRADQKYRNQSRVVAGVISILLALFAAWATVDAHYGVAVLAGLLAVPLAPIAKDLASSLQAAAQAVKTTNAVR
jgi:hypothetical protein